MGPAQHDSATGRDNGGSSLSDPPRFKIESKLEYREDMESWIEVVAQRATADRHFRGVCSTLALTVINSLPKSQQELVNSAVARGEIVKKHPSFQMQLRAVQQIVSMIAVDTPVEVVGRVSQAFREVSKCVRGKSESLKKFAVRFQGLAQVYLRISGATESDPAGMILALAFLENANLQPETRTQIQLQLSRDDEMDTVPLSQRKFIWDDHAAVDEYADNHGDAVEEEGGESVLSPATLAVRERVRARNRADKKYQVRDRLFEQPAQQAGAPLPTMTVDEIFVVMNRMPDLPEKADEFVSAKQLKSFMSSVRMEKGAAKASGGEEARHGQKRSVDQRESGANGLECYRCFSSSHLYRECPIREARCAFCEKTGHVDWLCYAKHGMQDASLSEKKKWGREQAQEQCSGGSSANASGSRARSDQRDKRARNDDRDDKPSAVFRKRRQG